MQPFHLFPCSNNATLRIQPSRREMLLQGAAGFGGLALATLLNQEASSTEERTSWNLKPRPPHFPARAKNVIFLYMGGGPSHIDLLDPKPLLNKYDGRPAPFQVEQRGLARTTKIMASPFKFAKHGQAGHDLSELLPHLAGVADEIAVVRSGVSTRIDHGEANLLLHTGRAIGGFPTMGSWIGYGLGTVNENLPAYVALTTGGAADRVHSAIGCGCLPSLYQATPLNTGEGDPFFYLNPPKASSFQEASPDDFLQLTQHLNRVHQSKHPSRSILDARIQNFELAARMQAEAMRSLDISNESRATLSRYGLDNEKTADFAKRCLLARRLVESGVRFVHLFRFDWDHHGGLRKGLTDSCAETDQPVAALIQDLKQRGLLDSTLVVWTGEFGRQPVVEGVDGRDHNPHGFSFWMAGGGVKAGTVYGATDEFGYAAIENKVHIADLHATMLHLLGLQHDKLTFEFEGRDETLTGVEAARVIHDLIV